MKIYIVQKVRNLSVPDGYGGVSVFSTFEKAKAFIERSILYIVVEPLKEIEYHADGIRAFECKVKYLEATFTNYWLIEETEIDYWEVKASS